MVQGERSIARATYFVLVRRSSRRIKLRSDPSASSAQTSASIRWSGSATARTARSLMSVTMSDIFFGHDNAHHIVPATGGWSADARCRE